MLSVSQCNTHVISEIGHWDGQEGVQIRSLGSCLNPTLAMFNHSCTPNTIRVNIGTRTLMVATKHIPAGHEITDSYSVQYQVEEFILLKDS